LFPSVPFVLKTMENLRQEIVSLLNRQPAALYPFFSGLISVTIPGLEQEGLRFHETHHDAAKMARAAASTYRVRKVVAL
jgi:hypothetical protein